MSGPSPPISTDERLDPETKAKWLVALRSGGYRQGRQALYSVRHDCYCCLGVLGAVCGLSTEEMNNKDHLEVVGRNDILGPWGSCLDGYEPRDEKTLITLQRKLAGMNDRGESFAQIADWIEANL